MSGHFFLLAIVNSVAVNSHVQALEVLFSVLQGVYLGVERISYGNSMFNFSEELPNWFPQQQHRSIFPPAMQAGSRFKYCSHPSGCKVVLRCCFHLHSPMIGYVEQLFMNILTICILSSFSKIYVDLFTCMEGMYVYKYVHCSCLQIHRSLEKVLGVLLNYFLFL